jgi:hypothetical protein
LEWILPDLIRYTTEMEQGLQQIMERLLGQQEEAAAQAVASLKELNECIKGNM